MAEQARSFGQDSPSQDSPGEAGFQLSRPVPEDASDQLSDLDAPLDSLLRAVGSRIAQQFFWKAETDTILTYEHRLTYRYVHVDRLTGQFYNQQRVPITVEVALDHALPSVQMARSELVLAPIVLEPYLSPFVRRTPLQEREEGQGRSASTDVRPPHASYPKGMAAALYRRIRAKFLAIGTYAKASAPVPNQTAEADRPASELSVAAFTRRTA